MDTKWCCDCEHYESYGQKEEGEVDGFCMKDPPVYVGKGNGVDGGSWNQPEVNALDSCSHFKKKGDV